VTFGVVAFTVAGSALDKKEAPKYIYRTFTLGSKAVEATRLLNEYTAEGWELVTPLGDKTGAFKRRYATAEDLDGQKLLEKLKGTWTLESSEVNGGQVSGEDKTHTFCWDGNKWRTTIGEKTTQMGTLQYVRASGDLFVVDLLIEGGDDAESRSFTVRSILSIDGDVLKYCAGGEGSHRPTRFETTEGGGFQSSVYKKAK
jgi:uncharacterized protein (TIGR03067 family)